MVKKIRFTIDALGEVKLDVEGAVGAECDRLTESFEKSLGLVGKKERKDSYFVTEQNEFQGTLAGDAHD